MAEIKIRGDISGSTTIKAPDSGSDEVIELSSALASKLPYSYGTATPSTTDSGFLWYDSNSTPAEVKFWDGSAFQGLTSGKVLQIVNATYSTQVEATSTTYVDTGLTATITPSSATSKILVTVHQASIGKNYSDTYARLRLLRGASEILVFENGGAQTSSSAAFRVAGAGCSYLDSPATTSAIIYKTQIMSASNTSSVFAQTGGTGASTITLMEIAS